LKQSTRTSRTEPSKVQPSPTREEAGSRGTYFIAGGAGRDTIYGGNGANDTTYGGTAGDNLLVGPAKKRGSTSLTPP
jgi:hypothetical protein